MSRRTLRHKATVNPWALLRPWCWLVGHFITPVYGNDAYSVSHSLCLRCLWDDNAAMLAESHARQTQYVHDGDGNERTP